MKTTIQFKSVDDVETIVRVWATENGFALIEKTVNKRKYKKDGGWFGGITHYLEIENNGSFYILNAWIKNLWEEWELKGPGVIRTPYRNQINQLLTLLDIPRV
jgi:hypothetical protein